MTVYPHRIRLRGPWECEPQGAGAEPPRRLALPCSWGETGLADFTVLVRFRRRFGYPGRIDSFERVWLTFAGVPAAALVTLNSQALGRHASADGPFEHEVTALLGLRNELVVDVEVPAGNAGDWGEVALEVRRTAFLRDVRAWLSGSATVRLHVAGTVIGTSEQPLDLYLLLGGRNVHDAQVGAAPEGLAFHVVSEPLPVGEGVTAVVRVDLVSGAVIWYAVEVPLSEQPATA
jgi:hypothetical protein